MASKKTLLLKGTFSVVRPDTTLTLKAKSVGAVVMDFSILAKAVEIVPKLVENWT